MTRPGAQQPDPFDRRRFDAILFDLDGVLTETADTHMIAWKAMFDDFLAGRHRDNGEPHTAFTDDDYLSYVDGKPRFDGVRAFLASRGIALPDGSIEDPPHALTVGGLGNRKNEMFNAILDKEGVEPFAGALRFVRRALSTGMKTAVVSSSANARRVLDAAGITSLFETVIDGLVARERKLAGKPDPGTFLEAARRLGVPPARAIVVEDALAGVAAGSAGGFGLVIGIGDAGQAGALKSSGADLAVSDLGVLVPD